MNWYSWSWRLEQRQGSRKVFRSIWISAGTYILFVCCSYLWFESFIFVNDIRNYLNSSNDVGFDKRKPDFSSSHSAWISGIFGRVKIPINSIEYVSLSWASFKMVRMFNYILLEKWLIINKMPICIRKMKENVERNAHRPPSFSLRCTTNKDHIFDVINDLN